MACHFGQQLILFGCGGRRESVLARSCGLSAGFYLLLDGQGLDVLLEASETLLPLADV